MSTIKGIFEPFKDYVQDQLNIRKSIMKSKTVGMGVLPQLFGAYISKQCTIRMASGVDVIKDPDEDFNPIFENNYEKTLHGASLAQAYVLEGGIRDTDKTTRVLTPEEEEARIKENEEEAKKPTEYDFFYGDEKAPFVTCAGNYWDTRVPGRVVHNQDTYQKLMIGEYDNKKILQVVKLKEVKTMSYKNEFMRTTRGGIGTAGAYGDPKIRGNFDGDYGLVPMPGIKDATIRTKSDDGSLREASVEFFCHNRKQLEILEMLYMRPGYPILLEWGWNPYVSNDKLIEEQYDILDAFFDENQDLHSLNNEITQRKINSGGNYDGFIGFCKNFSFKATGTGGFECTTEITAHGEILESLKSAQIVLPVEGSRKNGYSKTDAETADHFLLLLRSMKANLDKAGDQKYIAVKDSGGDEYTNWEKVKTYGGNIWKYGILSNAWSTGVQEKVFDEDFDAETESEQIKTYKTPSVYQKGFSLVLDTIKEILKVTDKDIKAEKEINSRSQDYGFDSFLYGTFLQEISLTEDVSITNNDGTTGKEKNIYVRWDLLCQLINRYVIPSYKSTSAPLVELTYLNPGSKTFDYEEKEKKIAKGEDNNKTPKFYLDYALPMKNKLHPQVKDEDLKKILGQSFDYGVCIMPHQFDDSLIVHKYDSDYVSPNPPVIEEVKTTTNDDGQEVIALEEQNPNYVDYSGSPGGQPNQQYLDMTNTGYYAVTPEEFATYQYDESGARIYEDDDARSTTGANVTVNDESAAQNEAENYQPLTSYEGVTFSNQSIGLVYFNLDYLLKIYEGLALEKKSGKSGTETRLKDKFDFYTFIDKIWGGVNEACAGYYDFSMQTEHDRPYVARIIDRTPAGGIPADSAEFNQIFQFEPQGLNSQLRDFYFSSKISSDIADTISIAAQSPNNAKSLDALSFKSFHKNITNRFTDDDLDSKSDEGELAKTKLEDLIKEYESKLLTLKTYQKRNNAHYRAVNDADSNASSYQLNVDSSTAVSLAKSIEELCININSRYPLKDKDNKPHPKAGMINKNSTNDRNAVIPLEFSLQMDGIGGISPLNLFKINKNRLPYGYQRDDIAFIVKGESQKITAGQDWTLELDGQLTLLNTNIDEEGHNPPTKEEDKKEDTKKKEEEATKVDKDTDALINPTEDQDYGITLNSSFPYRNNKVDLHLGLDIGLPSGVPLVAVADGTVEKRLNGGTGKKGYGQYIILTLDKKDESTGVEKVLYAHLKKVLKTGKVKQGDVIAHSGGAKGDYGAGSSGSDKSPHFGAHLHYEVGTMGAFTGAYFGKARKARLDTGLVLNPLDTINYSNGIGSREVVMPAKESDTEDS